MSSVAETAASRFRNASPERPYLNEIVSPCSVSFSRPSVARGGCAPIAAQVGPPPRPVLPAAPVEHGQLDAALAGQLGEPLLRAVDLPVRGEIAAVLARVGVADHHLQAVARRAVEVLGDHGVGPPQVVDRLEQRHHRDGQTGLGGQRLGRREVGRAARHRDDQPVERGGSVALLQAAGSAQRLHELRVALTHGTCVCPEVELRQVQAEDLDAAPERRESAVGDPRAAVGAQAAIE